MKMFRYLLEITVFLCGAIVMVFELVGSRVLGPYLGTSMFVWTSLIGIILGSLSIGYWLGGRLADKKASLTILSVIIFLSGVCIGLTILIKDSLLQALQAVNLGIKPSSVLASLVLFLPTSVLLGIVSPYAVKLKINSLNTSGSTVGNLYAISTIGSIVGTFLAGFYLIPTFGTNRLLLLLSFSLIFISIILSFEKFLKIKVLFLVAIIFGWFILSTVSYVNETKGFIDTDTEYNRIWIYNSIDQTTGQLIKNLRINNEYSSAMFVYNNELVYEYTKYYNLVKHFNPGFSKALLIGGAAYSYPKEYLKRFPQASMDVVEIDPKLTELAKKYFNLKDDPRLNIFHEDARAFLNKTQKKYDVIFGDAFRSQYSVPYQLTTKETAKKKFDILNDNGIVILNIISSIEGKRGKFLRAEYATYKSVFPQVFLFPVTYPQNGDALQNIVLVALKSEQKPSFSDSNSVFDAYLKNVWKKEIKLDVPILTDDFAPVDYYINDLTGSI